MQNCQLMLPQAEREKMIGSILKKIFGTANERELKRIQVLVDEINALESGISSLADAALRAKSDGVQKKA